MSLMDIVKRSLQIRGCYSRKSPIALFLDSLTALALGFVVIIIGASIFWQPDGGVISQIGVVLPVASMVILYISVHVGRRVWIHKILLKRHKTHLSETLSNPQIAKSAVAEQVNSPVSMFGTTKEGPEAFGTVKQGSNWQIYDIIVQFKRTTKSNQKYVSKQEFYTVFEAKLERIVPHLVFDAKQAKGKQFKNLYLQAQRLALEDSLGQFFDAYGPQHYSIDILSFITPEIIEVMLGLRDCDIELVDDSLFCYSRLLTAKQLADFQTKCLHLQSEINKNLSSYRDDRLSDQARLENVTDFGKQLLKAPSRYLPNLMVFSLGLLIAGWVILSLGSWWLVIHPVTIIVIGGFTWSLSKFIATRQRNRRLETKFLAKQQPAKTKLTNWPPI